MSKEIVGISGSNGKSIVTQLARTILNFGGISADQVELVEIVTSDLANWHDFEFDVSIVLNINEGSEQDFAAVYHNTKRLAMFNASDILTDRLVQEADVQEGVRAIGFTHRSPARSQIGVVEGIIADRAFYANNSDPLRYLNATQIASLDNYSNLQAPNHRISTYMMQNVVAAVAIGRAYGVDVDKIQQALEQFQISEHSNSEIYARNLYYEDGFTTSNISYVDDFDSHNLPASTAVLSNYSDKQIVWVVSGQTVSNHLQMYLEQVLPKLYAVVVIGDSSSQIYQALRNLDSSIPVDLVSKYEEYDLGTRLVTAVDKLACSEHFVIFSPAVDVQLSSNCLNLPEQVRQQLAKLAQTRLEHAIKVGWA